LTARAIPRKCRAVDGLKGKAGDGNGAGPILIDVREKDEWTEGYIPGARWISRGFPAGGPKAPEIAGRRG